MQHALAAVCLLAAALPCQAQWTPIAPQPTPSLRTEVGLESDGLGVLLFGGQYGPLAIAYDELWRYDAAGWTQLQPSGPLPSARSRFATCFDPIRQRFVVFGGDRQYAGGGVLGDTWEYDPIANAWIQALPSASPTPRIHARMCYDYTTVSGLLFGGSSGSGETWLWDGANWTQQFPQVSPSGRQQTHLCFDLPMGRVLMFGGSGGAVGPALGDTWSWNGSDWSAIPTATVPGGGVRNGRMAYDEVRRRAVFYGGATAAGAFSDTVYEFDGVDWQARALTPRPSGRTGLGMAFVPGLGKTLMFGGYSPANGPFGDTWSYQTTAPAAAQTGGQACANTQSGVAPSAQALSLPYVGTTLSIQGLVGPGDLPIHLFGAGVPAPIDLSPLGYLGCTLYTNPQISLVLAPVVNVAIPLDPAFVGAPLVYQLGALDLFGGVALSGYLSLLVGAL